MTTIDQRPDDTLVEEVLDDPARGRRRLWYDEAGRAVRVELADGTALTVRRDEADGTFCVTGDDDTPLISLTAGATVPAALRAMGLTSAQAAEIDGTHRLTATDPSGTTRTELTDRTVRVQRGDAVLRIDADNQGRPRRVTTPGYDDLICRWSDGRWLIHRLDGPVLLTIAESPAAVVFEAAPAAPATAPLRWSEAPTERGMRWSDRAGTPLVDTEIDLAGRTTRRAWHGGRVLDYSRDERGRLSGWAETTAAHRVVHTRQYRGAELCGLVTDGVRTVVRADEGGRIRKLIGPLHTVGYDYDANGRRTTRSCRGHVTRYRYDALGQLTAVITPERIVEYGWDALGRRISVTIDGPEHREEYREHRDPTGRLWSVTTAAGAPVCRFLWWNGRVIARCDANDDIDEIYLTDPFGTLLGVACAATGWRFDDAMQPPFGRVDTGAGWRPTLFGHISDDAAGLIGFGARELDPETGSFLTPDPWHGDPDDPRRLAGQPAAALPVEIPADGIHAYALGQHDPLSRPDRDGHHSVSIANIVLTIFLAPTWGAALTSLSLFLFAPLNFYAEIIGLFGYLWPQHSIFNLRGVTGSARLGTTGLALNGFFPRFVTGVTGDRCITIGHVAWESRHYFQMLDRARVLELDDIAGTPGPDGRPSRDSRHFCDTAGDSILAVTSTDSDRREWVHCSRWTRGPGNAVGDRAGVQSFEDRVSAGTAHARGTVFLAQPMPDVMPTPRDADDEETLRVDEYVVTGGQASTADLIPQVWFAVDVPDDSGITAKTVVGISAGDLDAAYGAVLTVVPGDNPVAILDHELPQRFTDRPDLRDDVSVQQLTVSTATSAGWALRAGAAGKNAVDLTAPGHGVAVGDVLRFAPTTPDPATPERKDAYTKVKAVSMALTVAPSLGDADVTGSTIYRLAAEGTAANGEYPDPAAHPAQLTFAGDQPFEVDELVQVAAGSVFGYGRVTEIADAVPAGPPGPEGEPGTPAVPASITLHEPLTGLSAGPVRVARLKETDRDTDKGTDVAQDGDVLTVKVTSTALLPANQPMLIDGDTRRVREIAAIGTVGVDTVDDLIGTGPFTLTGFAPEGSTISTELSSARFVRRTGGDALSSYGSWPAAVMGLVPIVGPGDFTAERQPSGWRYFLRANPHPKDMHPDFGDYWQPVTVAGAEYWLLSSELKIVREGTDHYWEPDAFDDHPRRYRQQITPDANGAFQLNVLGLVKNTVTRPDAGGGPVFAYPAEVQVPEEPRDRWSLADALADHELVHTLQNTWWGPILGAMPLQGAFRTVRDVLVANDVDRDDVEWMDYHPFADAGADGFVDSNWFEMVSIGGLMQIMWNSAIVWPALFNTDAREAIQSVNFDEWSAVFNPVNQAIINQIPKVRSNVPRSKDWSVVLGRALTRALDLKAWTPFMGFIKLWLPDGPTNFLEQQASRKSGNLYSNLLSVNDKFNAELAVAPNLTDANITAPLGDAVRLMAYYDGFASRNLELGACDAAGSHLIIYIEYFDEAAGAPILQFTPTAAALLPADLYEVVSGTPPTTLQVDGPASGTAAPPVTRLLVVPVGTVMRPRLRAIVPIPPRVFGGVGCYLVPAGPGVWNATIPSPYTQTAHTDEATITIDTNVTIGADPVPWSMPAASGAPPTGPKIARFVTEKQSLTVTGRNTAGWRAVAGSGVTLTARPAGAGWDLTVDPPPAGTPLPTDVRVRIWAPVRPNDADMFDLDHPDVPTLADRRSYLDDEFWIPVRDFLVTVTDLPKLPEGPPATMAAADSYDLDLPVKVAGPASIVPTGKLLSAGRDSDRPPRGERWRFTATDRFVESTRVVPVVVRFAPGVERPFDITVTPNFTLDAAAFDVTPAAALALTITGGDGPFTVVDEPPAESRATVTVTGTTVTVSIAPPPPAPPDGPAPPPAEPIVWQLKLRDDNDAIGARTLTLRP